MGIQVSRAAINDLHGLLLLYTQLHDNKMPAIDDDITALWAQIVSDHKHNIIVCKADENIVSSCVITIIPNLTHDQRPYALIENVITEEAHRHKGYASAVLDYAKQMALEHNCYKIMLLTGSKDESTLHFYRNAGYNSQDKTAFIQWL